MMKEEIREKAAAISEFLVDHKGLEVTTIDVTSLGHLRGLARELWGLLDELGLEVNNRHKAVGDDGWELIDCGDIVIHLMSQELRDFYSLEKLWQKIGK